MSASRFLDILIPTYNRPKRLHALLNSGLNLTMKGVFFIVIDDGSDLLEEVEGIGMCSTQQVCEFFNTSAIVYIRNSTNKGLAYCWQEYYAKYCDAKYVFSMVDKDLLINSAPIMSALKKLEEDSSLSMVIMPIMQTDRTHENIIVTFDYKKMSGKNFISCFIADPSLQHCTNYGIMRVSSIKNAGVPDCLNLIKYGLNDAFGIDIDFVLRIAATGNVDFESQTHLKKNNYGGCNRTLPTYICIYILSIC